MEDIEFKGYWSEKDKEIWQKTDWKSRDYKELPIEEDSFESIGYFYSTKGIETKKLIFIKYIRPNPIYSPYYGPKFTAELLEFMKDGNYCYPMYNGNTEGNYYIHDRFEDVDTYNKLSN